MNIFGLAKPKNFRKIARPVCALSAFLSIALFAWGLYLSLIASPPDYLQSESVRIMYIHVPAAWLSLFAYATIGGAGLGFLIWRHMLAGLYIRAAAPVGAALTALCLITGSIWGMPTWGTWWVWDARLTSVLVLFFLYCGIIALSGAFDNRDRAMQMAAWLSIIGLVNLPIIKFSVNWWNTLHQPASISTISRIANPAIAPDMLAPLLVMAGGYFALFTLVTLLRLDNEMTARRIENLQMQRVRHA